MTTLYNSQGQEDHHHVSADECALCKLRDSVNIKKAVEGSMEKRQAVMDSRGLEGEEQPNNFIRSFAQEYEGSVRKLQVIDHYEKQYKILITKATAQAQLEAEERVNELTLGHINNGMPIDRLKVVLENRLKAITQERERITKEEK